MLGARFLIDIFGTGRTMVRPYILGINPLSTLVCISSPGADALKSVPTSTDALTSPNPIFRHLCIKGFSERKGS